MPPVEPKAMSQNQPELGWPAGSSLVDRAAAEAAPPPIPVSKSARKRIAEFRSKSPNTKKQTQIGAAPIMASGITVIAIKKAPAMPSAGFVNAGSTEMDRDIAMLANRAAANARKTSKKLLKMIEFRMSASRCGINYLTYAP